MPEKTGLAALYDVGILDDAALKRLEDDVEKMVESAKKDALTVSFLPSSELHFQHTRSLQVVIQDDEGLATTLVFRRGELEIAAHGYEGEKSSHVVLTHADLRRLVAVECLDRKLRGAK